MSDKLYENQIQLEKYVLDIKSNMLEITKMTSNQKQMNLALWFQGQESWDVFQKPKGQNPWKRCLSTH